MILCEPVIDPLGGSAFHQRIVRVLYRMIQKKKSGRGKKTWEIGWERKRI
jgi:hypothetical protein